MDIRTLAIVQAIGKKRPRPAKKGGQNPGGNFANDGEKASAAGKKGGEHSHGGGRKGS